MWQAGLVLVILGHGFPGGLSQQTGGGDQIGQMGPWDDWSSCSSDCGLIGIQKSTRECLTTNCVGDTERYRACNVDRTQCQPNNDECGDVTGDDTFDPAATTITIRKNGVDVCKGVLLSRTFMLADQACVPPDANLDDYTIVTDANPNDEFSMTTAIPLDQGMILIGLSGNVLQDGFEQGESSSYEEVLPSLLTKKGRLPRINYQNPKDIRDFCVVDGNRNSRWRPSADCGLMESSKEMCMRITGPNMAFDSTMVGTGVYAEVAGRVWLIGTIVRKVIGGNKLYVVKRADVIHDELGCQTDFPGVWANWQSNHIPTNNDCECENWWSTGTPTCGQVDPLCIEYNQKDTYEVATGESMPATCPSDQKVQSTVGQGFQCHFRFQLDPFFRRCYCHDYQVRFKCPFIV